MENYSYLSQTQWNSSNFAHEIKQDAVYPVSDNLTLSGGWRYKRSDITKAYDVPGYWGGAYSSTIGVDELGPYGLGAAIYHSTDPVYDFSAYPLKQMPTDNRQQFDDRGLYLGGSYQWSALRFNLGLRYDRNSIWGSSINPRLAMMYNFNQGKTTVKTIYGEAYQEPPPNLLYGGWSGRQANPDLSSEQARNIELVMIHQTDDWLHDISLYRAKYHHVIREEALNDGDRTILGLEYRGKFEWPHYHSELDAISGNFYYSYTKAQTNRQYDHQQGLWLAKEGDVGDISPHKVNFALNWPLDENWELNFKANYYDRTGLYSRNALIPQGIEVGSRMTVDASVKFIYGGWQLNFKIENLADRKVFAPGLRKADSGNDFSARSKGYQNSLTPLPGRSMWITVKYQF
jgi:iron complex outermembrane receptor protein